jgi:hypothetical protein
MCEGGNRSGEGENVTRRQHQRLRRFVSAAVGSRRLHTAKHREGVQKAQRCAKSTHVERHCTTHARKKHIPNRKAQKRHAMSTHDERLCGTHARKSTYPVVSARDTAITVSGGTGGDGVFLEQLCELCISDFRI